MLNRSSEGKQYIQLQTVFVTTNSEYDTAERLLKYRNDMFTPALIMLRSDSNTSKDMLDMLRKFRVPVGLSDQEN